MSGLQVPSFPAFYSPQRASNEPSGRDGKSKSRSKVGLTQGHSLMDWVRLANQKGRILNGIGGGLMEVTEEELAKHNKENDAWTSIRGLVYNVTPYMHFHPGGVDELMRGAGKDGTDLFNEFHQWVNFESLLEKCLVGKLKRTILSTSLTKQRGATAKAKSSSPLFLVPPKTQVDGKRLRKPPQMKGSPMAHYDWYQSKDQVVITVYAKCKVLCKEHVIVDNEDRVLKATLFLDDHVYTFHIELEESVSCEPKVQIRIGSVNRVEIMLKKINQSQWTKLGDPRDKNNHMELRKERDPIFRRCKLVSTSFVTHDTNLMTFEFPKGTQMNAPIGYHVNIQMDIDGVNINRPYTVADPSLLVNDRDFEEFQQGCHLPLMIKVYPNGALTSHLGQLSIGDSVLISDFEGTFDDRRLQDCSQLIMLAAGTGFTPMIRLINLVFDQQQQRKVLLVFFNKTKQDILWRDQLQALQTAHTEHFKVVNILSQPDASWDGSRGHVSQDLLSSQLRDFEHNKESCLLCICGPTPFTQSSFKILKEIGYRDSVMHLFTA